MNNSHNYQYPYPSPCIYGQSDNEKAQLFKKLEQILPTIFSRQEAAKWLSYIISTQKIANLNAKRLGPLQKLHISSKVTYEKEYFFE